MRLLKQLSIPQPIWFAQRLWFDIKRVLVKLPKRIFRPIEMAAIACSALLLNACTLAPALDPLVGDTGQALSATAQNIDVKQYFIDLTIIPDNQSIRGRGTTTLTVAKTTQQLELKLDPRFDIAEVLVNQQNAAFNNQRGVISITSPMPLTPGSDIEVTVNYSGKPHVALNAPWSGGFVWSKTAANEHFIATAVQGEGCDMFWPCKDHFIDKADRTIIHLTVPNPLVGVTNGVLTNTTVVDEQHTRYEWELGVPASDYNIAINIAPYKAVKTTYQSINGTVIPLEFWALKENLSKANTLIENDLRDQIDFFEKQLGPYPWGTEKLGFVETPHLGMEHQTINAYGKGYVRDPHGFDWLLQHELAHEWFGNLMTHQALNDAWLHEGFGLYMQPAYARYKFGDAAYRYRMYQSYLGLLNCQPVVRQGAVTSDEAFNPDIYGKGGWTLHTLRWLIGEEHFWQATRELLYGTADTKALTYPIAPRYRSTQDFIDLVNRITGKDYTWLFDVYLMEAELPKLEQTIDNNELLLSWKTPNNKSFPMPIPVMINGTVTMVNMQKNQTSIEIPKNAHVVIDPNMEVLRYLPIIGDCEENQARRKRR